MGNGYGARLRIPKTVASNSVSNLSLPLCCHSLYFLQFSAVLSFGAALFNNLMAVENRKKKDPVQFLQRRCIAMREAAMLLWLPEKKKKKTKHRHVEFSATEYALKCERNLIT